MAAKDDFDYGDELPPGIGVRLTVGFVLAVFLITTFGTGIADTLFPVEGIKLVGEELEEQRELRQTANLWDGTLSRSAEDNLREHSRVRAAVLPSYSYMKFVYLDEVPSGIAVGEEHWMFLTPRLELKPGSDEFLAGSVTNLTVALDRRLSAAGIELVLVPIPRKSYVARNFLPRGLDPRQRVDDLLIEGLIERGVETVDLRELYRVDDPQELYFKLDTHWTPNAARIAAEETARATGLLKSEERRMGKLQVQPPKDPTRNGFATLMSLGVDQKQVDLTPLDLRQPLVTRLDLPAKTQRWFAQAPADSPLALAGTSFSHQQGFARLLTHYSGIKVHDRAEPAQSYMTTVGRVLEDYAGTNTLKRLYWETPIAPAFNRYNSMGAIYSKGVGQTFQVIPESERVVLSALPARQIRVGGKQLSPVGPRGRTVLVVVPNGALAHSGDGVAGLELRGVLQGGELPITLISEETSIEAMIEPGEFTFTLPLVTPTESAKTLRVIARPRQRVQLRLDSAKLVHHPLGSEARALEVEQVATLARLTPSEPLPLSWRSALLIQLRPGTGAPGHVSLSIETDSGAAPRILEFKGVSSAGIIAVDLGLEGGSNLTRVELNAPDSSLQVESASVTGIR